MCSFCVKTIPDFGVEHNIASCPLRMSQYCSYCAKYGHITIDCQAKPNFIEPTYLEQLISPSDLIEYNIITKTPIYYKVKEDQQLLEIKDDDKVITAYLISHSIKIQKGHTKRHVLEEYAKLNNKRLVYR